MNIRIGQRIRCKKSFVMFKDYAGFTFDVVENKPEDKSFSVLHIKEDGTQVVLPFWYGEFNSYFEFIIEGKLDCDCGFQPGVSAVHYVWCQTLDQGVKSA